METNINAQQTATSSFPQSKPAEKETVNPAAVSETAAAAPEKSDIENDLKTAKKDLQRIENQLAKKREQLAKLQAEIAELKSKQETITDDIEKLEAEDMSKQILELLKSKKLKHDTVRSLIESANPKPAKAKTDTSVSPENGAAESLTSPA